METNGSITGAPPGILFLFKKDYKIHICNTTTYIDSAHKWKYHAASETANIRQGTKLVVRKRRDSWGN